MKNEILHYLRAKYFKIYSLKMFAGQKNLWSGRLMPTTVILDQKEKIERNIKSNTYMNTTFLNL
jgi:hypothetical protein